MMKSRMKHSTQLCFQGSEQNMCFFFNSFVHSFHISQPLVKISISDIVITGNSNIDSLSQFIYDYIASLGLYILTFSKFAEFFLHEYVSKLLVCGF